MKLNLTGINHKSAPVEVRERLAFNAQSLPDVLRELKQLPGVLEGVVLSTCNRVEVAVTTEGPEDAHDSVLEFLARQRRVERAWLEPFLYRMEGREAIRHLFRVASSLDSMVVGEPQILGQMKEAWEAAREQGALNGALDAILTRAFNVAKRVRTETEIGQSAVSVSYAAVELARQIFDSLRGKKVLLIGAGKMSELAARHLARNGIGEILVTNRSAERARQMAETFHGRIVDYRNFLPVLPEVDVVIASSGAPHYILGKEELRKALGARRNRPMFLIDIAVPRNIDPAVNELENIFLYDIDDLQKVVETNLRGREREARDAERIIAEEVDRMMERLRAREAAPLIVNLQKQLDAIRTSELERMRGKFGALTPQQEEALEALTRGIINKIAHAPIAELRRSANAAGDSAHLELIRRLFRLDD